jgi:hypothetical protein
VVDLNADPLSLERREEAFHGCVVPNVAGPAIEQSADQATRSLCSQSTPRPPKRPRRSPARQAFRKRPVSIPFPERNGLPGSLPSYAVHNNRLSLEYCLGGIRAARGAAALDLARGDRNLGRGKFGEVILCSNPIAERMTNVPLLAELILHCCGAILARLAAVRSASVTRTSLDLPGVALDASGPSFRAPLGCTDRYVYWGPQLSISIFGVFLVEHSRTLQMELWPQ